MRLGSDRVRTLVATLASILGWGAVVFLGPEPPSLFPYAGRPPPPSAATASLAGYTGEVLPVIVLLVSATSLPFVIAWRLFDWNASLNGPIRWGIGVVSGLMVVTVFLVTWMNMYTWYVTYLLLFGFGTLAVGIARLEEPRNNARSRRDSNRMGWTQLTLVAGGATVFGVLPLFLFSTFPSEFRGTLYHGMQTAWMVAFGGWFVLSWIISRWGWSPRRVVTTTVGMFLAFAVLIVAVFDYILPVVVGVAAVAVTGAILITEQTWVFGDRQDRSRRRVDEGLVEPDRTANSASGSPPAVSDAETTGPPPDPSDHGADSDDDAGPTTASSNAEGPAPDIVDTTEPADDRSAESSSDGANSPSAADEPSERTEPLTDEGDLEAIREELAGGDSAARIRAISSLEDLVTRQPELSGAVVDEIKALRLDPKEEVSRAASRAVRSIETKEQEFLDQYDE